MWFCSDAKSEERAERAVPSHTVYAKKQNTVQYARYFRERRRARPRGPCAVARDLHCLFAQVYIKFSILFRAALCVTAAEGPNFTLSCQAPTRPNGGVHLYGRDCMLATDEKLRRHARGPAKPTRRASRAEPPATELHRTSRTTTSACSVEPRAQDGACQLPTTAQHAASVAPIVK